MGKDQQKKGISKNTPAETIFTMQGARGDDKKLLRGKHVGRKRLEKNKPKTTARKE